MALQGNLAEIRRALGLIVEPGSVVEMRALRHDESVLSGYFDDVDLLARTIAGAKSHVASVYVTLNPVDPALLARANNRVRDKLGKKGRTTDDSEVTKRTRLLVDVDHDRPSGISATDAEHKAAIDLADKIRAALKSDGWPDPVFGDSGNGAHLVYAIDLPSDDGGLVARVLSSLAAKFNNGPVRVDAKVFNPSRISKVYGTVARKGDDTPERPHRLTRVIEAPDRLSVVPRDKLESVAAPVATKAPPSGQEDWDRAADAARPDNASRRDGDLARAWPKLGSPQLLDLLGGEPWVLVNGRVEGPCPAQKGRCAGDPRGAFFHPRTDGGPPGAFCSHKGTCGSWTSLYDLVLQRSCGDRRAAVNSILRAAGIAPATSTPPPVAHGSASSEGQLPRVRLRSRILDMARDGENALISQRHELYSRAGEVVHVVRDSRGSTIKTATSSYLKALLSQAADWIGTKRDRSGEPVEFTTLPPRDVVEALANKGSWAFPTIDGIVSSPALRADGSVLDSPGYDAATRLLYEPSADYPPVPHAPTRDQARAAVVALSEPFQDFPFVAPCHRSALLALVLTILGRPAIPGPCPLFLVRAAAAGTGKQLLVSAVGNIAIGTEPVTFAAPREDEEWAKKITTHVRSARAFVVIDEARHLESPSLASAITQEFYSNRLLGLNEDVHGRVPIYASCGNQTTLGGDMGRRVIPIELDAQVERPEERDGFQIPDLPAWISRERPRIVSAALTALRAFVVAGKPSHGKPELGSFSGWSRLVRGTLVWCGEADPVAGQSVVRSEADVGTESLGLLLVELRNSFAEFKTVREIVNHATHLAGKVGNTDLRDSLASVDKKGEVNSERLGYYFRKHKNQIVGGFRLVSEPHDPKQAVRTQRWMVEVAPGIPRIPHGIPQDPASHEPKGLESDPAGSRDGVLALTGSKTEKIEEKAPPQNLGPARDGSRDPAEPPSDFIQDDSWTSDAGSRDDSAGSSGMRGMVSDPDEEAPF